ncbi:MAG: O-antigen ligase family protein [Saprospiraceae bacterium]|nr:O-antigen ligase family protein [Saprospiraceae bacterium]
MLPARIAFISCLILVVGITWSPFLLSLSEAGLFIAGLMYAGGQVKSRQPGLSGMALIPKSFAQALRNWLARPDMLAMALLFAIPALSYFWTEFKPGWWNFTRVRLPFLLLPIAFANWPALSDRQYKTVLYALVWTMVVLCIGVGINFALHFDEIMEGLGHGRPVPVPKSHIRFSLIVAVSILSGGWLWFEKFYLKYTWERGLLAAAVIFLFGFIHVLSVRSGLAALYAALVFTAFWIIWRTGRWKLGLVALGLMLLVPVVAIQTVPSLRSRLYYMQHDWVQFRNNQGGSYSDADRWVSLQTGYWLWKSSPVVGVGTGDLLMDVQQMANDRFPTYSLDPKMPHNQFLFILSGTGLLGLMLSLAGLAAPVWRKTSRQVYLFMVFQVIVFLSFMVEYTLETAVGVAFYLFFTLFFMHRPLINKV